MRMAVLAGFGWTIGFILFALPDSPTAFQHVLVTIFKYLLIHLNATPSLFISVVYEYFVKTNRQDTPVSMVITIGSLKPSNRITLRRPFSETQHQSVTEIQTI
ncbi:unnamed protein product [Adineta steineri]|uniref:Uncharacterized protein n=1 Tax=Adineta steineri TaxID=433720 RepID=A0A815PQG1_9BILA|nr:unnamed protein product [Adineta steineri]CAF1631011.1 unnamed protein product [Adineta steineri]